VLLLTYCYVLGDDTPDDFCMLCGFIELNVGSFANGLMECISLQYIWGRFPKLKQHFNGDSHLRFVFNPSTRVNLCLGNRSLIQ
jgi:hypothetical protein